MNLKFLFILKLSFDMHDKVNKYPKNSM